MKDIMGKLIGGSLALVAIGVLVITLMTIGINDNGYRTVIQYPNGTTTVKFTPGWYVYWFGTITQYPDVITFDYDDIQDDDPTLQENGLGVRYQDGGTGTVYGKDRFILPTDEKFMLKLHRSVRSANGLANKIIRPVVKQAHQLTAGLLTSEGAYAEQRGTYINWVQDQVENGPFATELDIRDAVDPVTGKITKIKFPIIKVRDGKVIRNGVSDLGTYGISMASSQITNWDFEKKTLTQIAEKRKATMSIITSRAEAEKSKQDAITAEEKGKANVMTARYEEEVLKEKAVVVAQREKEVAEINAAKLVEVARQEKLQAEQQKLGAYETKKKDIALGQGEAERKRLVMQADGALTQKLEAYVKVNYRYADAMGKQKWVPEIQFGSANGEGGNGNAAGDLINMLLINQAKELGLNMKMKATK